MASVPYLPGLLHVMTHSIKEQCKCCTIWNEHVLCCHVSNVLHDASVIAQVPWYMVISLITERLQFAPRVCRCGYLKMLADVLFHLSASRLSTGSTRLQPSAQKLHPWCSLCLKAYLKLRLQKQNIQLLATQNQFNSKGKHVNISVTFKSKTFKKQNIFLWCKLFSFMLKTVVSSSVAGYTNTRVSAIRDLWCCRLGIRLFQGLINYLTILPSHCEHFLLKLLLH